MRTLVACLAAALISVGAAAAAPKPVAPAKPAGAPTPESRKVECQKLYRADVALCSDLSCKVVAMRHWQQCLKTGRYW